MIRIGFAMKLKCVLKQIFSFATKLGSFRFAIDNNVIIYESRDHFSQ